VTKNQQKALAQLEPNQVVRKHNGYSYFGLKSTALDDAIKSDLIPKPVKLTPGGRAVGWFGWQIIEWQRQRIDAADKR
jgi:predicted DNA-binding transcriptional regulator AlpA